MEKEGDKLWGYAREDLGIFGADIDIPSGGDRLDITETFKSLAKYIPRALVIEAILIGELETKPAYRIRIKGIVPKKGAGKRNKEDK